MLLVVGYRRKEGYVDEDDENNGNVRVRFALLIENYLLFIPR